MLSTVGTHSKLCVILYSEVANFLNSLPPHFHLQFMRNNEAQSRKEAKIPECHKILTLNSTWPQVFRLCRKHTIQNYSSTDDMFSQQTQLFGLLKPFSPINITLYYKTPKLEINLKIAQKFRRMTTS